MSLATFLLQKYQNLYSNSPAYQNNIGSMPRVAAPPNPPATVTDKINYVGPGGASTINVSTLGWQLNEFSKALAGDTAAKTGLQNLVVENGQRLNPTNIMAFSSYLQQLQQSEPTKSIFNPVTKTSTFIKTALALKNPADQSKLLQNVNEIFQGKGSSTDKSKLLDNTLSTINKINSLNDSDKSKKLLSDFLNGLNSNKILSKKSDFVLNFQKKNLPGTESTSNTANS
ncbi:MAG: hypothetical protein HQM08_03700 [Candidatus Riflebacteria bacterium]|nr:hypothetical protein [Candidatus Riflebacteria bacterium]